MNCLHIVNKSPFNHQALNQCLASLGANDSLLLIEDGTYAALPNSTLHKKIEALEITQTVYLLKNDAEARAITAVSSHIQFIDYADFVRLATEHKNSLSWF